jgi:hypothetical protein
MNEKQFLEVLLGTSKVFQVDQRTRAIIESRLGQASSENKEKAILFRALIEYCIYEPTVDDDNPIIQTQVFRPLMYLFLDVLLVPIGFCGVVHTVN